MRRLPLDLFRLSIAAVLLVTIACSSGRKLSEVPNEPLSQPTASQSPTVAATPTPGPFNAALEIGVVIPGTDCSELHIRNTELQPGDRIFVVDVENSPHKKLAATIVGPNNCPKSPVSGIEEIYLHDDVTSPAEYEIRFDEAKPAFGFGIVIEDSALKIVNGTAQLKVNKDSTPLYFRECSGNESTHLTVWEGKPLTGKRIWHSFFSLSYDTVPTCKPAEYK